MALLLVDSPDGHQISFPIRKPELFVGRDSTCDIILNDAIASRRHARFFQDADGLYWIQDLQSRNGILLNHKKVATAQVRHGDRIGIGTSFLMLVNDEGGEGASDDEAAGSQTRSTSAWGADQRLDLPRQRLEALYELNERLTGRLDRDDLLGELLELCTEQLRFERAGIAVWPGSPLPPQWVHLRNLKPDAAGEFHISRSVVDRALHQGERILIVDTADGQMDPTVSMISNNIRSAMCVPMSYHQEVRGVIYGDRTTSTGGYTREDIDFLAALGRLGAMGLANVQLVEEMNRRQHAEAQLRMAREIQAHLFPAEPLDLKHVGVHIDAINDPGLEVSGDYYDYFLRRDGRIAVVIADVSGKGVPASLLMANLQAAVQLKLADETDLAATVDDLNALISRNLSESRFITAMFGLLDPAARKLTYVNAGHLPPYLIQENASADAVKVPSGFPIGVVENAKYEARELVFPDTPSTLLLYTDGVTEAMNEQGELFTDERLAALLRANLSQPPRELVTRVRRSIKQFTRSHPQTDDITLVALRLA